MLLEAYGWTIFITVFALIIGIILGTLLAVFRVIPQTNIVAKILSKFASMYVSVFRGTPLMVQLFIFSFVIFANVVLVNSTVSAYLIAVIGFGLNSAAYVSENIRAGILSIDKGQMEAGRSLGMSWGQTMIHIVIPQAFRRIIPQLGNEFIAMLKDSSLVSVIGFEELTRKGQLIIASTYGSLEIWTAVAIIYLIMTLSITRFVAFLEKRFK